MAGSVGSSGAKARTADRANRRRDWRRYGRNGYEPSAFAVSPRHEGAAGRRRGRDVAILAPWAVPPGP